MYKRFSIGWTEEEYIKLEEIVKWYSDEVGISMTKSAIIKALLFSRYTKPTKETECA